MSQPTHGNACKTSMDDGHTEIPPQLEGRIVHQKFPYWLILLSMFITIWLTIVFTFGGRILLWFCDESVTEHKITLTLCVILFNSLQMALAAFFIFGGLFGRKKATLALRGWKAIACGSCGHPYDVERMPALCSECGSNLESENSLRDFRKWKDNKAVTRFAASLWYPMLLILFLIYISIAGWINFINKLF